MNTDWTDRDLLLALRLTVVDPDVAKGLLWHIGTLLSSRVLVGSSSR